jgi:hypothetical protein
MRLLIVFSVFAMLITAADKPGAKTKPAAKAAAVKPLKIPAGAVESDGGWRYTDAQGKKWIYRKTPFGVARMEDKPDTRPAVQAVRPEDVKATESGEYIRFERPGPFGTYKWQAKKTELNELEQAAWKRAQASRQD